MTNFDKKELLKIAELSALKLYDSEIPSLVEEIKKVLTYTEELKEIKHCKNNFPENRNKNILREDIIKTDVPENILANAPKLENDFFVVPPILNKKQN